MKEGRRLAYGTSDNGQTGKMYRQHHRQGLVIHWVLG